MRTCVLASSSVKTFHLNVDEFLLARQASLRFEASGDFPMQALLFEFAHADGTVIHEIGPEHRSPTGTTMLSRIRRLPGAVRCEHLLRRVTRRMIVFHIDVPPAVATEAQLLISVKNLGRAPVALGNLQLNTSPLAPGRTVQNVHSIEGYSERISVSPGERLRLFIHAPLLRFELTVTRHGSPDRCVLYIDEIAGKRQDYAADAYKRGAEWEPTYTLEVGANWRSGLYSARIADTSGASFDITFIVKKVPSDAAAGLAVLASTNTWQAYNVWGGASLYRYEIDDGLCKTDVFQVHMQRPNPAASMEGSVGHLANAEKHVLGWLDLNQPAYDLYADSDLHADPALLLRYRALLISTHSEYWTDQMYSALVEFLDQGGNLIYLSGNGLYWKTAIHGQQLEVRCDSSSHTLIDEAGGRWRDLGRPESKVLGIRFTRAGYRSAYKPYKVITPGHWIFDGTGVEKGSLIGESGLNMGGASGWEIDKIDRWNKPPGLVHLAKGTNPGRSGADMTYFAHPGGGGVFSTGSITFGGSLAIDPILGCMLKNVLAKFLRQQGDMGARSLHPNGKTTAIADST